MKYQFLKKNKTPKAGFTLVETLVAVSIFTVSAMALMVVLSDSVANSTYAKKKIIATYLAQEGIEYMRNMRDTYVLYQPVNSNGWDDFMVKVSPCDTENAGVCYFDDLGLDFSDTAISPMKDVAVLPCVSGVCPYLLYDQGMGKYNYTVGSTTDFIRSIRILNTNTDEMRVATTVSWTQGSGTYEVTLSANLFDWTQ